MNNTDAVTAWTYCVKCDKFDSDGSGLCTGAAWNWPITDDNPPCEQYKQQGDQRL